MKLKKSKADNGRKKIKLHISGMWIELTVISVDRVLTAISKSNPSAIFFNQGIPKSTTVCSFSNIRMYHTRTFNFFSFLNYNNIFVVLHVTVFIRRFC